MAGRRKKKKKNKQLKNKEKETVKTEVANKVEDTQEKNIKKAEIVVFGQKTLSQVLEEKTKDLFNEKNYKTLAVSLVEHRKSGRVFLCQTERYLSLTLSKIVEQDITKIEKEFNIKINR